MTASGSVLKQLLKDALREDEKETNVAEKYRAETCTKISQVFNTPWAEANDVLAEQIKDDCFDADYTTLHTLARVSATDYSALVYLGFDNVGQRYVVIKDYSFEGNNWLLPKIVQRQIETYYTLRRISGGNPNGLQECLGLQITKAKARFVFKYYPMLFCHMFRDETPKHVLLQKAVELVRCVVDLHDVYKIAHRDIKSANCCLTKSGKMVVIDFDTSISGGTRMCSTLPVCTYSTAPPEYFQLEWDQKKRKQQQQQHLLEDGDKRNHILDDNNLLYDAYAGDWWSVGCVIAEMYLGYELFNYRNEDHTQFYRELAMFSKHMLMDSMKDIKVKNLKRRVPTSDQQEVWTLLRGLFVLEAEARRAAVDDFLQEPKIQSILQSSGVSS